MGSGGTCELPDGAPTTGDLIAARERIEPYVHRTPVFSCTAINELVGAELFFKCENLQKVGAFKARGAVNHVFSLPEEIARRGVVTHSSGNHAQALALAARERGVAAHIVMPRNAPQVKVDAVHGYGATITFCEPTEESRKETARTVLEKTGGHFVHPFNDPWIIAGQGSAAAEVLEQVDDPDMIVAPVGGGGLLSGTALAVRYFRPNVMVWGAEPTRAGDAHRSLSDDRLLPAYPPATIADGLLTGLGELTFGILRSTVAGIGLCEETSIVRAMRLIWERMKLLVEPSGAVPLAAILENSITVRGKRVAIILSGGNIDLGRVSHLLALDHDRFPGET